MNQTPAVILNVQRQPGANTISVVKSIKQTDSAARGQPAHRHSGDHAHRSHDRHRSVGFRRRVRIDADDRAGRAGHLSLPAKSLRHHHPERGRAAVAGRHLRRDVRPRLQPGQPIADGADHLHRFRGGRRHRDDREHLALHRSGRSADGSGAQRRGANWLHHSLADRVADRRADSAVIHGRRRRAPVSRVCRDARRHHRPFGGGLPDAHAHDERAHPAAHAGRAAGALLQGLGARFRTDDRVLRADAEIRPSLPDDHAAGRAVPRWC